MSDAQEGTDGLVFKIGEKTEETGKHEATLSPPESGRKRVSPNRGSLKQGNIVKPGAHVPTETPGAAAPRGVRLQLPEGAENAEAKPPPPRRGRVRGMSAVKRFQEEYVESDFLGDLDKKAQAKKGQKTKAPMPNMVDLWSQVSGLKEEALVLKKSEAELKMETDDLRHVIKGMEWKMMEIKNNALKTLERQEMSVREGIETNFCDLRLMLSLLMHDTEPALEEEGHHTVLKRSASVAVPSTKKEMNEALLLEISRRHELEERLAAAEGESSNLEQVELVMDTLERTQHELNEAKDLVSTLKNTVLEREQEMGDLAAIHAQSDADVSKLEIEIVMKDSTISKLKQELAKLRHDTEGIAEDKKKLQDAHKRLAEAEVKAIQSAAQATVVAQAFESQSPLLSPRSARSTLSVADTPRFNTSPRGGYSNPYLSPSTSSPRFGTSG